MTLNSLARTPADVARDERGAVTIIGLSVGTFLVGSMWWTIGIGRAMMIHDKLQEASDAMASAGSTVHARGMNLISTINLVMLALVAIYIIMSIIVDVLQAGTLAVLACAAAIVTAPVCGPMTGAASAATQTARTILQGYERVMQPTLIALSYAQTGVAIVMPYTAQIASIRTAIKYKQIGFSFSPALIPGGGLTASVSLSGPSLGGTKLGLPVSQEKMGKLCEMAGAYAANWLQKTLGKIPGIGLILNLPGLKQVINKAISTFAKGVRKRYCSGGFWEQQGPKQMWDSAENGNDWMQNWSFTINSGKQDPNEPNVSLGTYRYYVGQGAKVDLPDFFSQSEMFFDCDGKWDAPTCNGPGKKAYDYAVYGLKWRNRLRRFRPPSFGDMLGGVLGNFLGSSGLSKYVDGSITDIPAFQNLQSWSGQFGGELGSAAASDAFGFLGGKADEALGGLKSQVVGKIPGGGNGPTSLILH